MNSIQRFFDSDDIFMPHGHCYLWYPEILWLNVLGDAIIAFSYFSIPVALAYFAHKRKDIPFNHLFILFGCFILLCGMTHLFGIWTIWHPDYGEQGLLKAATAFVSLLTAIMIWRLMPALMRLPSPTVLQEANEKLHATNQLIEAEVLERTAALAEANQKLEASEKELRAASETASRANEAKSHFLAHMSHEIRTPLSVVTTIADVLPRTGKFTAKQQELIETLQVGSEALLALINNILDISKIEAGEFELEELPFEWDALIDDTARVVSVRANEKGIDLRTNTGALTGCWLMGDRARLRQILTNLLGNAVKFTEEGEVALTANIEQEDSTTPMICLTISDSGIGIPADKLERVFELYGQSDSSMSTQYGGTGLGLAITRHLVEMMGGDIKLESVEGEGTVALVRLPLQKTDAPANSEAPKSVKPATTTERGLKILLVEDYPGNILVATTLLDELGYSYDLAKTGKEALSLQEQDATYDAVLMDINMPEMDGLEATRIWREREEERGEPRTHIIGLTAHAMAGDDARCLAAGMDSYLPKPLTLESLRNALEFCHEE